MHEYSPNTTTTVPSTYWMRQHTVLPFHSMCTRSYNLLFDIIIIPSEAFFISIDEFVDACGITIPGLFFSKKLVAAFRARSQLHDQMSEAIRCDHCVIRMWSARSHIHAISYTSEQSQSDVRGDLLPRTFKVRKLKL